MSRKTRFFLFASTFIFCTIALYTVWRNTIPLLSPIALIEVLTHNTTADKSNKIIYGFFPYWNLKYADKLKVDDLTHFAYFALDLNPDGTINKANSKKEQEPGWNKLNTSIYSKLLYQIKLLGQRTVLTITAMEKETITSILEDSNNSQRALRSIIDIYREKGFDSLNIDFEYAGKPSPQTIQGFTNFIQSLKENCLNTNPKCQIDVDIFADTAEKTRLWDLVSLNQFVDNFIVMTYDYHYKSSTIAGPVSPITGKCVPGESFSKPCLEQDIVTHLSQITKLIPSQKILLGIPFYGYEWQTASREYLSNTYPKTGALATYGRVQSLFSNSAISSLSAQWSNLSLSPYLVYEENEKIYQIHYENSQSIEQKIKLVRSANLGGVAIWALGYETPFTEIWQPIKSISTY